MLPGFFVSFVLFFFADRELGFQGGGRRGQWNRLDNAAPCTRLDYENVINTLWHLNVILARYATRPTHTEKSYNHVENNGRRRVQVRRRIQTSSELCRRTVPPLSRFDRPAAGRRVLFSSEKREKVEACLVKRAGLALCLHHESELRSSEVIHKK